MAVEKGSTFIGRDVYIDYPYMRVMFRSDYASKNLYIRSYGKAEFPTPIGDDNEMFNEAVQYGVEISRDEYLRGK